MGPRKRRSTAFVDPSSLSGLRNWYDASDVATITKDGSNLVSSWANKAPATYNLTSTTTVRPTYYADDGDGKPSLRFAAGNYIRNTTGVSYPEDSFFLVVEIEGLDADLASIVGHGTNLVGASTASGLNWSANGSVDGSSGLRMGPVPKRGQYIILSGRRSSAYQIYYGGAANTGMIEVRENGAILKQTTHSSAALAGGIYLSNSGNATVMRVRELVWYERCLSDAEQVKVEDYLNAKWAVYDNFAGRRDFHDGLQRWFTKTGNTAPSASYPLIPCAGQSNMVGRGDVTLLPASINTSTPITGANIWFNPGSGDEWQTLQAGVNTKSNSSTTQHGLELSLAKCFTADFGTFYTVKHAEDGTNLKTQWIPTADKSVNRWRGLIDVIWAARYKAGFDSGINLLPIAMVWYQGEDDAGEVASYYDTYEANEQIFIAACRAKILGASNMKFISVYVGSVGYGIGYQTVNAAKTNNSASQANYPTPVARWGQGSYPGEGAIDSVHANSQALVRIGNDCALRLGCTYQVTP